MEDEIKKLKEENQKLKDDIVLIHEKTRKNVDLMLTYVDAVKSMKITIENREEIIRNLFAFLKEKGLLKVYLNTNTVPEFLLQKENGFE
jgi:hypothetical protein